MGVVRKTGNDGRNRLSYLMASMACEGLVEGKGIRLVFVEGVRGPPEGASR